MNFRYLYKLSLILNSQLKNNVFIGRKVKVKNCKIGKATTIGNESMIVNSNIGKFCSIAQNVKIGLGKHPVDWISTSTVFYKKKNLLKVFFAENKFEEYEKIKIGNDVWIGANVIIKDGITIGDGAIVGAGAIVTKNVDAFAIVAGNPAKLIRYRFEEDYIKFLLEAKWWNLNDEDLKKLGMHFNNPIEFREAFKKLKGDSDE